MMRSNPWWSFADHPQVARGTTDAMIVVYYLGLMAAGAEAFFFQPSAPLLDAVQLFGAWIWSAGTLLVAACAVVCRLTRSLEAESICLVVLAALTLLHGVMFLVGTSGSGYQTATRLMVAPLLMLAVVMNMRHPTVRMPALPSKRAVRRSVRRDLNDDGEDGKA